MRRWSLIAGAAFFIAIIAAAIVPLWVMTADVSLSGKAYGLIALMIVFCFGVGGGLMFLIFYSARRGYDEEVHYRATRPRSQTGNR